MEDPDEAGPKGTTSIQPDNEFDEEAFWCEAVVECDKKSGIMAKSPAPASNLPSTTTGDDHHNPKVSKSPPSLLPLKTRDGDRIQILSLLLEPHCFFRCQQCLVMVMVEGTTTMMTTTRRWISFIHSTTTTWRRTSGCDHGNSGCPPLSHGRPRST